MRLCDIRRMYVHDINYYTIQISHSKLKTTSPRNKWVNPSGAETRIYNAYEVDTMGADALAPCIIRSSATMVVSM